MAVGIKQADILIAVVSLLRNDADLLALLPSAEHVKNHLPQDFPLPYVRVRLAALPPWDTKCTTGYEVACEVDCWTDHHGDLVAHQLADAVVEALQLADLGLAQGQTVLSRHDGTTIITEPDGQTHHAVVRFRFLVAE